jgi:two-component system, OmpR family, sensor kinase
LTDQPCDLDPEANQSDDFFRNVNIQFLVHELKGPLDVIQTNIRMLLEGRNTAGALTPFQEKALKRSVRSAAKMRDIIHSLLEVGRSQTGRIDVKEFELFECAAEVLVNSLETVNCGESDVPEAGTDPAGFLSHNGIRLTAVPEICHTLVRQDKTKFMYILGNLARNGLSHRRSRLDVEITLGGTDFFITVADDGPGIAPQDRESLFKRYAQKSDQDRSRQKGHGLGLAGSQIMARTLGGDVTFDMQCGAGARFLLKLPLQIDDQAARLKGYEVQAAEDGL